jgi:hypothetical protein
MMIKVARFVILAAIMIAAPTLARTSGGYQTVQSITVDGGSIQILEDARLTPALARKLWQTAVDPVFVLGEDAPEAQTFKAKPLRPAKLRQIDGAGIVVMDLVLNEQAPIARLERRRLGPAADPVYLITTDDSAGMGSYSGLATALYALQAGRFGPVRATGSNGRAEAIILVDTLKSGWKTIDRSTAHTVIEQLFCRPDFAHDKAGEDARFQLTYITYWSDGRNWRMAKRVRTGFWENEGAWPAISKFPKAGVE